jgi:hypothetical protein
MMFQEFQALLEILGKISSPALAICGAYIAYNVNKLTDSVNELNTKIAVVVTRVDSHEHRLNKLEE